jgi:bis(5'-nucleosyl)-tetraphosphatase (symmetrical)
VAIFAIGDVQGCHDELMRLLERVRFDPADDRLWFCGDLVNRGRQSLEVLRAVRKLGARALVVLGNHDLHLVAAAHDPAHRRPKDTFGDVLAAPDGAELLDWLRRRPLLHHDAALGYTLVHAGLAPQWDLAAAERCAREVEAALVGEDAGALIAQMYGDRPDLWSETLTGIDRLRFCINCFTRVRFVDADGRLALEHKGGPGTQPAGLLPWFEHPARRSTELHVVFGHWSTLDRRAGGGIYPLDTGCLWGGRLTALRLDGDGGWFSVPCN